MTTGRDATVATVDIVCGTLQVKLHTKDLPSGSSFCILFGSRLLTPCKFQRLAGKASTRNWKMTIPYLDLPLSRFLESYTDSDGRRCGWFMDSTSESSTSGPQCVSTNLDDRTTAKSQHIGSSGTPGDLVYSLAHSQPVVSDLSSLDDQPAQQFFDHDTVPLADLPPSQLLDSLPLYLPVTEPKFVWGTINSVSFIHSLDTAYCEVRHWIWNSFMMPRNSAGRAFVSKLARLFRSAGEGSALESIALKAVFVVCALVLRKPSHNSKERDHICHLELRLKLWKDGTLDELLCEGRVIQSHLRRSSLIRSKTQITHAFTRHMFEGNTRGALQLLIGQDRGGVLNLNDPADPSNPEFSVRDALNAKHPPAQPLHPECLLPSADTPAVHPVVFDSLDDSGVCAAALHTVGAAGPSGIDARGWRRLCTSFCAVSDEFCGAIALFTRRLCTTLISPYILSPFWDAGSLRWTSLQEFGLLEFVRWCDALWQRLPSMLFEMTFKLQQDHINSVRGRLLGWRLLFML